MEIRVSRRVRELSGYAFAEVDQQVYSLYDLEPEHVAVVEERIPTEPELSEEFGRLLSYSDLDSAD